MLMEAQVEWELERLSFWYIHTRASSGLINVTPLEWLFEKAVVIEFEMPMYINSIQKETYDGLVWCPDIAMWREEDGKIEM